MILHCRALSGIYMERKTIEAKKHKRLEIFSERLLGLRCTIRI